MVEAIRVYNALDAIMPFAGQESWDNSGLLLDSGKGSNSVLVCLDVTDAVIDMAEKTATGIIVSHHPLIFSPLKKISDTDLVYRLIGKDISVISAHTNFDKYREGTGYCIAQALKLKNIQFEEDGICLTGDVVNECEVSELAYMCKEIFGAATFSLRGKKVGKVFVCPGSGGGLTEKILASGADCFITGECGYHNILDLKHNGVSVISLGHDLSERVSLSKLAELLNRQFPDIEVNVFIQQALTESL